MGSRFAGGFMLSLLLLALATISLMRLAPPARTGALHVAVTYLCAELVGFVVVTLAGLPLWGAQMLEHPRPALDEVVWSVLDGRAWIAVCVGLLVVWALDPGRPRWAAPLVGGLAPLLVQALLVLPALAGPPPDATGRLLLSAMGPTALAGLVVSASVRWTRRLRAASPDRRLRRYL